MCLGRHVKTSENIIGTPDGVYLAGAIRRKTVEARWSREIAGTVLGTPSEPTPGSASTKIKSYVRPELHGQEGHLPKDADCVPQPVEDNHRPEAQQLFVRRQDFHAHGPSP